MDFKNAIRAIPDFPSKGIIFRDITPVLQSPQYLKESIDNIADLVSDLDFDIVIGPESRGFIFGVPLAYKLDKGFVPVRKAGKLPYKTVSKNYDLEYGTATIEMHVDALKKGQKVIIVDDLLATGGTGEAIAEIVKEVGAEVVGMVFLIELEGLNGRDVLKGYEVRSAIKY